MGLGYEGEALRGKGGRRGGRRMGLGKWLWMRVRTLGIVGRGYFSLWLRGIFVVQAVLAVGMGMLRWILGHGMCWDYRQSERRCYKQGSPARLQMYCYAFQI